ncbi:MAG: DUF429 domain-containing protein [Motilibacteraceae bacterium]
MRTAGVDLAAQDTGTALAVVDWEPGRARLVRLQIGVSDRDVLDAVADATKTGLDAPLGWPAPFVEFLAAHHPGQGIVPTGLTGAQWRKTLTARATDLHVAHTTGVHPLSVSADKIAHVALRAAGLQVTLAANGTPVDRTGGGPLAETYPAATLKCWGFPHQGYKNSTKAPAALPALLRTGGREPPRPRQPWTRDAQEVPRLTPRPCKLA